MSGYNTGTITATNQVVTYFDVDGKNKILVYGSSVIKGNLTSPGDSGGVVYLKSAAERNLIAGTIIASNSDEGVKFTPRSLYEDIGFSFDTSY
ncbi:hypothetical protein [Lachnoclostridium phytofermentans]|uniref:Peptidase S1 domain-containing protein n=1 Tax=Lachnoclostridium phytofermentans (strain ATCC 700394 / DSM 18823 / ISDg) TaxID=357809 RepID=A9KTA8_LACP7|nr:hypothetical protein [Lachnoclostridium phytofermentans]ABX43738.1 hypothetical protein Cphy_3385 [Lachnoclostridium phytofermentans ISDg]